MFKKGQIVKFKDLQYSEVMAMHFPDKETYEIFFGVEGVVSNVVGENVIVAFERELETIHKDWLEPVGMFVLIKESEADRGRVKVEIYTNEQTFDNRVEELSNEIVSTTKEVEFYDE